MEADVATSSHAPSAEEHEPERVFDWDWDPDVLPHRWTFPGQRTPWCDPIPSPSAVRGSYTLSKGGLSPMLMKEIVERSLLTGDLVRAELWLEDFVPAITGLGRQDWSGWLEDARSRVRAARSG